MSVPVPHRIPDNAPFIYLSIHVSGNRLSQQYSRDGRNWSVLDDWIRTPAPGVREPGRRLPLDGRFGLFVQPSEELSLSNFLFYPDSK